VRKYDVAQLPCGKARPWRAPFFQVMGSAYDALISGSQDVPRRGAHRLPYGGGGASWSSYTAFPRARELRVAG